MSDQDAGGSDDSLPSMASIASKAIDRLDMPAEIKATLRGLQADITLAYQKNFVSMVQTMNRQASAIDRMQATLQMLVEKMDPDRTLKFPVPIRVVEDPDEADMSAPLIIADPIGAGYVMSQADLASALRIPQPAVSVLVRAFRIKDDEGCAVIVRRGSSGATTVNYHPRAVAKFTECVNSPPAGLDTTQQATLRRARKDLGLDPDW